MIHLTDWAGLAFILGACLLFWVVLGLPVPGCS